MSVIALLAEYVAPVVMRLLWARTLGTTLSKGEVAESLSEIGPIADYIRTRTGDARAAKRGARIFEYASEAAVENLATDFEQDDTVSQERYQGIMQDVADLLEAHGLRLMIETAFNEARFVKAIGDLDLTRLRLDAREERFYRLVLQNCGRNLFAVADKLPNFEREVEARQLRNERKIMDDVAEAVALLEKMAEVSTHNNPIEAERLFERDYRKFLSFELNKLRLFGIPDVDYDQPLSVAYVHLQAVKWEVRKRRAEDGLEPFRHEREEMVVGDTVELITAHKRLVIVGRAGAGKTTLLKWIAVRVANQDETMPEVWRNKVPFYVRVRDYADTAFPAHSALATQFGSTQELKGDEAGRWTQRKLKAGEGVILLDGLDEVRNSQQKAAFKWLERLQQRYPEATYIVSTRPATLDNEQFQRHLARLDFARFDLQDLLPAQVDRLIRQWHEALADENCTWPIEPQEATRLMTQLRQRLVERRQLQDLTRNPLLCAMLCALHQRYKGQLPHDRVKLYQLCLETLLSGRDVERGVDKQDYTLALRYLPAIQAYLGRAAYWMMRAEAATISRSELTRQLELPDDEETASQIVKYLVERSSLLQEQAKDEFVFSHRSFQEYLAAQRMVHDGDMTEGQLRSRLKQKQWRDTIRLAGALGSEQDKKNLLKVLNDMGKSEFTFLLECFDWMRAPSTKLQAWAKNVLKRLGSYHLNLRNTDIASPTILSLIENISRLDLINTAVTDAGLPSLASLSSLSNLDLSNTAITGTGLPSLASLPTLSKLYLSNTAVTDAGLPSLASLSSLSSLDLSNTAVTDAGLPSLVSLSSLSRLNLSNTAVTDAGLPSLASLSSLSNLDLSNTAVTDAGLPAFASLPTLSKLYLSNTDITDAGLPSLASLSSLSSLDLSNNAVTDAGLPSLASLSSLSSLDLRNIAITDAGLPSLVSLSSLSSLYLSNTAVTDAGLPSLVSLSSLSSLYLSNTAVTDAGLPSLVSLPSLSRLYLSNTAVTDAAVEQFKTQHKGRIRVIH